MSMFQKRVTDCFFLVLWDIYLNVTGLGRLLMRRDIAFTLVGQVLVDGIDVFMIDVSFTKCSV